MALGVLVCMCVCCGSVDFVVYYILGVQKLSLFDYDLCGPSHTVTVTNVKQFLLIKLYGSVKKVALGKLLYGTVKSDFFPSEEGSFFLAQAPPPTSHCR